MSNFAVKSELQITKQQLFSCFHEQKNHIPPSVFHYPSCVPCHCFHCVVQTTDNRGQGNGRCATVYAQVLPYPIHQLQPYGQHRFLTSVARNDLLLHFYRYSWQWHSYQRQQREDFLHAACICFRVNIHEALHRSRFPLQVHLPLTQGCAEDSPGRALLNAVYCHNDTENSFLLSKCHFNFYHREMQTREKTSDFFRTRCIRNGKTEQLSEHSDTFML